jgi:hypothetical protein
MAGNKRRLHDQKKDKEGPLESWISSLAKESTDSSTTNKAGRIEKRQAKLLRREDRKAAAGVSLPKQSEDDRKRVNVQKKQSVRDSKEDILQKLATHIQETVATRMEQDESPRPFVIPELIVAATNKKKKWHRSRSSEYVSPVERPIIHPQV